MNLDRTYLSNTQITLSGCGLDRMDPDWSLVNAVQSDNLLCLFLNGEGWLRINHRDMYPIPGDLLLVPAGAHLSGSTSQSAPFFRYWCRFGATVGDVSLFDVVNAPQWLSLRHDKSIVSQFEELVRQYESDGLAAPFIAKSLLFHMVSRFMERSTVDPLQTESIPSVHKLYIVLQYIDKHLAEQITVEQLAQLVHFHPNYFLHYFKSMLGISPIVYINKKRMQRAQTLLLHTELSIAQISEQLGMQAAYLSRMFKKMTGSSPIEFRRLQSRNRG
ncbi:MAG: AraC family transcriptional regulator [Paenibacillaceae bacterium]|jgi:AraC-like DNA-binding protein|nr:AraC family transcriptional regulator [Paenibacillaceae bacterium]